MSRMSAEEAKQAFREEHGLDPEEHYEGEYGSPADYAHDLEWTASELAAFVDWNAVGESVLNVDRTIYDGERGIHVFR